MNTELSVRAKSTPPLDSPNSSNHEPISPQQQQQFSRNNSCFKCHKPGHWARDCPEKLKSPFKSVLTKCDSNGVDEVPQLRCRCGAGICNVLVSHTDKNPNRMFYKCPAISKNCGMFKWCDKVNMDEINNPRQYRFPECDCGSGTCNLVKLQDGPNAGRECFVCPITKGYGACSFSQLFDHQIDIIINGEVRSEDISSPSNIDLSTKYFKKRDLDSPVNKNPQNTPSPVAISEPSKRPKSANSSPKPYDPLLEGFASNASKSSFLTSHAGIHSRQIEFWRLISSTGPTSVEDTFIQVLGLHALIWLGRFVYSSPQCLKNLSTAGFLCCVIPNFISRPVLNMADMLEPENLETKLPSSPAQERQISTDGGGVEQTDLFEEKISESYRQNALNVQNLLVDQLESMDILDHEHMLEIANVAFESLNHLKVDYTTFHERVMEFISCASSLAAIEWLMHEEPSSHRELIDRHAKERDQFDYISCCEAEAMAALRDSSDHLRSLQEEASSLKNKLADIENQLLVGEKETKEHENRLAVISQKLLMSQKKLWEVEEAARLCEERELERMTAEAALDKARLQLPQC